MQSLVIVAFARDREYEIRPDASHPVTPEEGRLWLTEQWNELGCVPTSPVGKVLLLDTILHVAQAAGERRFADGGPWTQRYALSVIAALGRPAVRVDVGDHRVG